VLITYFDEVKYHKARQPYYWMGAITADADAIASLEKQLNDLAEQEFGARILSHDTEFHAADILNGHEQFEGWSWERRIGLLKRLISIFGSTTSIGKIYVRIEPARMVGSDVEGTAFMYLVERVDGYLRAHKTFGLLIGDLENQHISAEFAESLSIYRTSGTSYRFGTNLRNLIDTVHFTRSHHSRMLQLADLHIWLRQLCFLGDKERWHRKQVIDHVRAIPDCLHAHRYKIWPTADSWTRVSAS
jgi:hypothetical protein